jgi:hypothetical protein
MSQRYGGCIQSREFKWLCTVERAMFIQVIIHDESPTRYEIWNGNMYKSLIKAVGQPSIAPFYKLPLHHSRKFLGKTRHRKHHLTQIALVGLCQQQQHIPALFNYWQEGADTSTCARYAPLFNAWKLWDWRRRQMLNQTGKVGNRAVTVLEPQHSRKAGRESYRRQ